MVNCSFQYAGLFGAAFRQCKLTGSSFSGANTAAMTIEGGDWSYTDLREQEFYKMRLEEINFKGADFNRAKLEKCRIRACNLEGAVISGASFRGSDLRDSVIDGLDILGADFHGARIDIGQAVAMARALGAVFKP